VKRSEKGEKTGSHGARCADRRPAIEGELRREKKALPKKEGSGKWGWKKKAERKGF